MKDLNVFLIRLTPYLFKDELVKIYHSARKLLCWKLSWRVYELVGPLAMKRYLVYALYTFISVLSTCYSLKHVFKMFFASEPVIYIHSGMRAVG